MDYSKVNSALSGWAGPSSRRDRQQAELGQAMQLMQMNQQVQADREQKEQKLDEWMQHIQTQASQIAVRNEDREVVQGLYDQEKDTFLKALEKSGNDPVKFMNSGGRKVMQTFYNNIANSDESKRIKSNTVQVQSYYESLEGNEGKNAHLISNQTRRDFNSFMNGDIDSFKNNQLQQWSHPKEADIAGASNKAQAYLNSDDNHLIFKSNYLIEYDLPSSAMVDGSISEQELENYVAGYVGGTKAKALAPQGSGGGGIQNKSYGARITQQFRRINRKVISTGALKGGSDEYSKSISDFDSGRFTLNSSPESTDIVGNRGFEGDELIFAQMRWGENAITDLDGGTYIDNATADGTMYDEEGELLPMNFEIGSIQPAGVYLGYKIKTNDGYRLVKAEDLDGESKDVEHVLIQEYQDSDWFTGKERYYLEVDTENPTKMATVSKEKGIDSALGRYTAEAGMGESTEVAPTEPSGGISFGVQAADIKPQLQNYDAQLSYSMKQMGLAPSNIVSRSLLLALSSGSGGDVESSIGQLNRLFNPDASPEIHAALVSGDSKTFFDLYLEGLVSQGVDKQQAMEHLKEVDKLRDQIQKAYN